MIEFIRIFFPNVSESAIYVVSGMISGTCISIVNEVIIVTCGLCNAAQQLEFQDNQVIANTKFICF